jgi:hypothetical protein
MPKAKSHRSQNLFVIGSVVLVLTIINVVRAPRLGVYTLSGTFFLLAVAAGCFILGAVWRK